jgi:hypothetical protein
MLQTNPLPHALVVPRIGRLEAITTPWIQSPPFPITGLLWSPSSFFPSQEWSDLIRTSASDTDMVQFNCRYWYILCKIGGHWKNKGMIILLIHAWTLESPRPLQTPLTVRHHWLFGTFDPTMLLQIHLKMKIPFFNEIISKNICACTFWILWDTFKSW